jgi:hypothetical protein
MIVFVEVVTAAEIKASAVHTINGISGLMEYLGTKGQFICDLLLK